MKNVKMFDDISAPILKKNRNLASGVSFSESATSVFTLRVRNNGVRPKEASYDQKIFTHPNSGSGPCYSSPQCDLERRGPNRSFWDGLGVEIESGGPVTRVA